MTVVWKSMLIAEPNEVVRTGLALMTRSIPSVGNVMTCEDPEMAVHILRRHRVSVMLISEKFGAGRTEELRQDAIAGNVKYLVTMQEGSLPLDGDALDMVADGIVLLDGLSIDSLADTLSCLAADQAVLPAGLLQTMLSGPKRMPWLQSLPVLTSRELQVLNFVADGLSNRQIARKMSISEHGVKRYIANLLAKLNCPNRTLAVSYAIQGGLLGKPPASAVCR
jgi:two-component system nitrate/nitrite response regulator NarL